MRYKLDDEIIDQFNFILKNEKMERFVAERNNGQFVLAENLKSLVSKIKNLD